VGNMPQPAFHTLAGALGPQPDCSRRLIPLRVQMAASFVSQILTLRQSAIGYATSLTAERGIAKAHRPETETWTLGDEEETAPPGSSAPTVQLTRQEQQVYNNALRKLDDWITQEDDDLPWKWGAPRPADARPVVAEAVCDVDP
jgi:hypothetical protein